MSISEHFSLKNITKSNFFLGLKSLSLKFLYLKITISKNSIFENIIEIVWKITVWNFTKSKKGE